MTRCFITGATGYIGKVLVQKMIKTHDLAVLVRKSSDRSLLTALGVDIVEGDLSDPFSYNQVLQDCDIVIHLAADVSIGVLSSKKKKVIYQTNVVGTNSIIQCFKKENLDQFIFISSRQIFGNTKGIGNESSPYNGRNMSYYAYTKALAHQQVRQLMEKGLIATVIIPGSVYYSEPVENGIGLLFKKYIQEKIPFLFNSVNSYVYLPDLINAIISSIKNKNAYGEDYIIVTDSLFLDELFSIFEEISGIPKSHRQINIQKKRNLLALNSIARATEIWSKIVRKSPLLNREAIANMTTSCILSNQKSINQLKISYSDIKETMFSSFSEQFSKINF